MTDDIPIWQSKFASQTNSVRNISERLNLPAKTVKASVQKTKNNFRDNQKSNQELRDELERIILEERIRIIHEMRRNTEPSHLQTLDKMTKILNGHEEKLQAPGVSITNVGEIHSKNLQNFVEQLPPTTLPEE